MNEEAQTETLAQAREEPQGPPAFSWPALIVRMLARIWVVVLLLGGAGLGGMAIAQVFQKRAELAELRREPGPSAYAVLAYRAELERQIAAISADRNVDAVPTAPARPALLEEIDLARSRNASVSQSVRAESLGAISAPP